VAWSGYPAWYWRATGAGMGALSYAVLLPGWWDKAGYVAQRRAVRDTRQRVWLRLTGTGRSAYRGHVAAPHRIVGDA
jgi:hypothetical protein